jgi:hypothetical protein
MVLPGVYRHYKGQRYEVLGVARHSETEEEFVVYRALYGEEVSGYDPSPCLLSASRKKTDLFPAFRG